MTEDPEQLRARIRALESERAELERAQRVQSSASHVLERVATGAPLRDVLHMLIENIEAVKPEVFGSVLLLDESGTFLHKGVAPRLPAFYNEAIDGLGIGPGVGSCGTCAFTGEPVIVADVMTHPYWAEYRELARRAGVRACWSHPIRASTGRTLGTFAMYYAEPRCPDSSDLELITFAAHLAGIAIERTRTQAALRASEERLRILVDSAPVCIHEIDLDRRLASMNATGRKMIGAASEADVIGTSYLDCVSEPDRGRVAGHLERALHGEASEFEFVSRIGCPRRVFASSFVPIRDEAGAVVRIMGVAQDITDRKQAEQRQDLMIQELDHRVKNNLAAVISVVQQTASRATSVEECEAALTGRLHAMAIAHEMLAASRWTGVPLHGMLTRLLGPYGHDAPDAMELVGPEVMLPATIATPICTALHELAVNAAKYGALSGPSGRVNVAWECDPDDDPAELRLVWRETGGPSVVPPRELGRGTRIIEGMIEYQLHGTAELHFDPAGLRCEITVPLAGDDGSGGDGDGGMRR